MSYDFMDDSEVKKLSQRGDAGAFDYLHNKSINESLARQDAGSRAPSTPFPIWPLFLALPLWVVSQLAAGLVNGVEWLGTDSWLAPLFPAPGEGVLRYLVGTGSRMLMLPGGLVVLAGLLRDTRARILSYPLVALAVIMVPLLLWTTQVTTTASVARIW